MTQALVCSYQLGTESQQTSMTVDQLKEAKKPVWVHLDVKHAETRRVIAALPFKVPDLAVAALLAEETRPRLTLLGQKGFILNLRGVNLNEGADPVDTVSIRMWSDGVNIVSTRMRRLKAIDDIRSSLEDGTGPEDVSAFISRVIKSLIQRMEPTIDLMDDKIEELEDEYFRADNDINNNELIDLRRKAIILRRYLVPQRDALLSLVQDDNSPLDEKDTMTVNESLNRLNIYLDTFESLKDRAHLIKEEMSAEAADRMNRNMYILSIIAAIFLPLGFLTGLLGINVGGIPGAENGHAFWIFLGMLVIIVGLQIYLFKKKNWL